MDWWQSYGRSRYPHAADLLLLCDNGGSNGSNRLLFKEQLQCVADRTDLSIRVAHYPSGCSKYNPIEHRLFPHVTRKLQGLFLKSSDMFRDLARRAVTAGGLRVFARTLHGLYRTGMKAAVESVDELHILFRTQLPK